MTRCTRRRWASVDSCCTVPAFAETGHNGRVESASTLLTTPSGLVGSACLDQPDAPCWNGRAAEPRQCAGCHLSPCAAATELAVERGLWACGLAGTGLPVLACRPGSRKASAAVDRRGKTTCASSKVTPVEEQQVQKQMLQQVERMQVLVSCWDPRRICPITTTSKRLAPLPSRRPQSRRQYGTRPASNAICAGCCPCQLCSFAPVHRPTLGARRMNEPAMEVPAGRLVCPGAHHMTSRYVAHAVKATACWTTFALASRLSTRPALSGLPIPHALPRANCRGWLLARS
ncbi:hypothetical protein BDU57DRAFT_249593 [Ampelomyces quisqualis]|uniref:Uncharacterized protein n=1 Tax=Ampelomyces quisqualis TaxID=50730 RepID=A0A6A5QNF9_AMPQU|nr:hypothetical protein BDU57DRAFT_249593 [Ampelomyces quisqualis]